MRGILTEKRFKFSLCDVYIGEMKISCELIILYTCKLFIIIIVEITSAIIYNLGNIFATHTFFHCIKKKISLFYRCYGYPLCRYIAHNKTIFYLITTRALQTHRVIILNRGSMFAFQ